MEHYRSRISIQGKKQRSGSSRRTVENDPLNHSTGTDPNYSEPAIAKENDHDMHNFVQALKTIHGVPIEHVEQLLLGHNTACSTIELCGQERDMKWAESRNWQEQYKILEQKHEDLQQKFNKIDSEMQAVKDQNEMMVKESKLYQAKLQEKEDQLHDHERGRHWQAEYEKLEMRYQDLQRHLDQQKMMVADKIKIENDHETLKSMFSSKDQELLKEKSEKSHLLHLVKQLDTESKTYQAQLQEKESQLKKQREAMKEAYEEKDDAMSRLSRHMGQQMSEENPNDTYLSDPNRPSKLGERYSELYDNEWTNAFEVLTTKFGKDDKEAVDVLRNILWTSYKSAFEISRNQMEEAEYMLSGSTKAVSPECKRLLKETQKHIDIKQADDLIKNALQGTVMKDIERKYPNETLVHVFAKECFQLCWLMSIQDPPVVLVEDPTKGSRFDTNIYKHYIHSGDTVDYVVWPALLLHKGGPVLTKGVAQPFPRFRPKSEFFLGENKKTNERTFDKLSWSLSLGKVQEKPSPADRRNPNQDAWAAQKDSSCQKQTDNHPAETQTYTSQGGMAATQRRTEYPKQFGINQSLLDDQDAEQFNRFCRLYPSNGDQAMRRLFGSNFDRYYELLIFKEYGNHTSA